MRPYQICIFLISGIIAITSGQSLSGTHFKIAVIQSSPFVYGENDTYVGFLIDMVEELQTRLGFTYELYQVPDGKYGREMESGEWNGLIGELTKGNADVVLAPLTITEKRTQYIQFSIPYMDAGIVPLYLKPQPGEKLPFQNLKQLVGETHLKYGAIADGGTYSFFRASNYQLYQAMGEYMKNESAEVMARTVEEAAARVREGGYVFLGEEAMQAWMAGEKPCDMIIVGRPINSRFYGIGFPKGSETTVAAFNKELINMKSDGMFQIYQDRWWEDDCKEPKLCVCEENNSDEDGEEEDEEEEES